jgi:cob(I)alamin adenosyltransferase
MKIYTKNGDGGKTFNGFSKVAKHDPTIAGQGELDELNAWIGILIKVHPGHPVTAELHKIQTDIFNIGGQLATGRTMLAGRDIAFLEEQIDIKSAELPELRNFIYPTNEIHVARAVCRRAERTLSEAISLNEQDDTASRHELVIPYLNRLSDYLFVIARCFESDIIWKS